MPIRSLEPAPPGRGMANFRALALAMVVGLAACQSTPAPLTPETRLLDLALERQPHKATVPREFVTIAGVMRPTIDASKAIGSPMVCNPGPDAPDTLECQIRATPALGVAPWVVAEAPLFTGERKRRAREEPNNPRRLGIPRMQVAFPSQDLDHDEASVTIPKASRRFLRLHAMPALERRAVTTPPIELAAGSALRTSFGIEETAWVEDAAPVAFVVSLLAPEQEHGQEVFRRVLDPARKAADRRWHTTEIPLPIRGGREKIRLRFETRDAGDRPGRSSLPVWGDPTILTPQKVALRPRRIVLISLDTLRARSMSTYGHDAPTTPFFTELARTGALFENAFTTFSNTLGSHMSMLTGLYPGTHLVLDPPDQLDRSERTLAEHLRDAGYETAAFTENALLRAGQFRRGFGTYFEEKEFRIGAGTAERTFERSLEWARNQGEQPFFLFIHTYQVHAPYRPRSGDGHPVDIAAVLQSENVEEIRLDYEQEIVELDGLLRDLLAELAKLGPEEDLLLVITADHGEEFREHGAVLHTQLYDEVMHIPLLLRWPGVIPSGLRNETAVSLVDIVPTVLSLAGLPVGGVDGQSLLPLLKGKELARTTVFGHGHHGPAGHPNRRLVGRSAHAKCMLRQSDEKVHCYDLRQDPGEKRPLAADANLEISDLHDDVVEYGRQYQKNLNRKPPRDPNSSDRPFDPQRNEKLRALGYIE